MKQKIHYPLQYLNNKLEMADKSISELQKRSVESHNMMGGGAVQGIIDCKVLNTLCKVVQ